MTPTPWHCPKGLHAIWAEGIEAPIGTMSKPEDAAYLVRCVNSHEVLVQALMGLLDRYTSLVNSGDCGNWEGEEEDAVKAAHAALAQAGVRP